jgi:hypothetical protein
MSKKNIFISEVIAIVVLVGAFADNPYGYYQVLRWIVSGVCGYIAFESYKEKKESWMWIMGVAAILYNPIAPIYLDRSMWEVIDVLIIIILAVHMVTGRKKSI